MKRLYIPNLVLTIVSDDQKKMNDFVLKDVFSQIRHVGNLQIKAPSSLSEKDRLETILYYLKKEQVEVEQVGLTTDGEDFDEEIAKMLDEYNNYIRDTKLSYGLIHNNERIYIDYISDKKLENPKLIKCPYMNMGKNNLPKPLVTKKTKKIKRTERIYEYSDNDYVYIGPIVSVLPSGALVKYADSEKYYGNEYYGIYDTLINYTKECHSMEEFDRKCDSEVWRMQK